MLQTYSKQIPLSSKFSEEKFRILYVCPLAHLEGHPCFAAISETESLVASGQEVTLLTFAGLLSGSVAKGVRHITVLEPSDTKSRRLIELNSRSLSAGIFVSIAFFLTLLKAMSVKRGADYDVIQLRDGTGLFASFPQILGIFFTGNSWLISLLDTEDRSSFLGGLLKLTKLPFFYHKSLMRNRYAYACQNHYLYDYYSRTFLNGILDGKIHILPPVVSKTRKVAKQLSMSDAKSHFGISPNQNVLLSFGALHAGKDLGTILRALVGLENVTLLHAGRTNTRLLTSFNELKREYASPKFRYHDDYIDEESKATYFAAASALILSYVKEFDATSSMLWEACRFRVPVIASDNRQLSELVSKYDVGLTFCSQNSDSLRQTVMKFLSLSPDRVAEMRRNCDKFCEDFSSESWARTCIQIYSHLRDDAIMR